MFIQKILKKIGSFSKKSAKDVEKGVIKGTEFVVGKPAPNPPKE